MQAVILSASPRREGNSAMLAAAVAEGLRRAGHEATLRHADEHISGFLRDCRVCRGPDGECTIADGYGAHLLDEVAPAEGLILATPIWWYGMAAQAKAFFDRQFCYVAESHPRSAETMRRLTGKRIGLVTSSEESFPMVAAAVVAQVQEYARYMRGSFVGHVHGVGNARGEVAADPRRPLGAARRFGEAFFDMRATDYQIDTPRPKRVWG